MRKKVYKGALALLLAVSGVATVASASPVASPQFYDFSVPSDSAGPNFTPSPFLDNTNAAAIDAFFAAQLAANPDAPLAVKIREQLTSAASLHIFDKYKVKYVFLDVEDVNSVGIARALHDQIKASQLSSGAFISNFNFYPVKNDPTRPGSVVTEAKSFADQNRRRNKQDYIDARLTMASPALYPGSPDYRNPANGNSSAPNIRSADFVLPIQRLSLTTQNLPKGNKNVPWVTRFNNFGNLGLDSDGNASNGYRFVQNAALPQDGQLPSRGDFSAQVLHYRLRGADSVNLFHGSIEGYSADQERADALEGFTNGAASAIFSRNNYGFANLGTFVQLEVNPRTNGGSKTINTNSEKSGVVWSGVYDKSGSNRQLVILLSNLNFDTQKIDIDDKIGGKRVYDKNSPAGASDPDDFIIEGGAHRLLQFKFNSSRNRWELFANDQVFLDNNRNGVGIPEPGTFGLLGLSSMLLLARRRRQVA